MSAVATTVESDVSPPRRGRPRRADVDAAILAATIDLLVETGVAGFSMDLLAQRAGVGKATIYRRWASREELILEALETAVAPLPDPDTGSLRRDLQTYMESLVERVGSAPRNDVLPHLLEASCYDEQLRASLEGYVRDRQSTVRTILRRGISRGELPADADIDVHVDAVLGPFFYRRLLSGAPLDRRFTTRLVDHILR